MALANIFSKEISQQVIDRINKLSPATQALWGKMSVDQMLAHCSVTYEMVYENKHHKPNAFTKFLLKLFVKNTVINELPYKKLSQTAPAFKIVGHREFEAEKKRLIEYILKTQELGQSHFENKESHSFGILDSTGWNNMFYKHLDHHLKQFGV